MKDTKENLITSHKSRIHWVDIAKGILILLLLIHHFGPAIKNSGILKQDFNFVFVWQFLFVTFFMQAFFILSGFCSNFNKPISLFVKDLFKQLVIPLLFFQFIHYIWFCYNKDFISIGEYLLSINGTTYWFIFALIICKLYIYIYLRFSANYCYLLVSALILFVFAIYLNDYGVGNNFLSIRNSLGSIIFVVLGQYAKGKEETLIKFLPVFGCVFPFILALLIIIGAKPPFFTALLNVNLKTTPIFLITSVSGTMAFLFLCVKIGNSRFFEYFGRNSLLVYGFHFIPLKLFVQYFYNLIHPDTILLKLIYLCLVYISEIVICIMLVEIFNKKPFKWLVGNF